MSNENKTPEQSKLAAQDKPGTAEANVQSRLNELTNVNRIVTNALALIMDVEIKGGHANAVSEILGWLTGFSQSLTGQIKTLEATLPKKPEAKKPELKAVSPVLSKGPDQLKTAQLVANNRETARPIGTPDQSAPTK